MNRLLLRATSLVAVAFACACTPTPPSRYHSPSRLPLVASNDAIASATSGETAFALAVARHLAARRDNVVFSPYALRIQLAMEMAGTIGPSAEEIRRAARFTLPQPAIHDALDRLDQRVAPPSGVGAVTAARALFWATGSSKRPRNYFDRLASSYGAEIWLADIPDDQASLDDFAGRGTRGGMTTSMNGGDNLWVLMSALTLHASWARPWSTAGRAGFLSRRGSIGHLQTAEADVVEMPYAGGELSLLLIAPYRGRYEDVVARLDEAGIGRLRDGLVSRDVVVEAPALDLVSTHHLTPALEALGMVRPFTRANDSVVGRARLCAVMSQMKLRLDASGVDASTLTTETFSPFAASREPPPDAEQDPEAETPEARVAIDRPFVAMIRHVDTGALIALALVRDPTKPGAHDDVPDCEW